MLHGWASTAGAEGVTEWPGHEGMWPMFSERFDTRQPGSEFYPLWNAAIGRYQCVLRQGQSADRCRDPAHRPLHRQHAPASAFFDEDGSRIPDEEAYGRRWMRNRENHWWQDLGMQDAGWTYEFFDGSLLLHDDVSFADGLVQPNGPGYQALIVYQSELDPDVAAHLLDWARQGLKVLVVNGARELKLLVEGLHTTHERAAARTPGLDGRDGELAATMAELLALPTVAAIDDPAQTVAALRDLGVAGRAEFTGENRSVLSHLREDGDLLHLYLYHFLYETGEPTEVEVALPGIGAVHRIDAWTGDIRPHSGVRQDGGRTHRDGGSRPRRDRAAHPRPVGHGRHRCSTPPHAETVAEISEWTIAVESWDAGELAAHHRGPRARLPDPRGAPDHGDHPHRRRDAAAAPVEGHP